MVNLVTNRVARLLGKVENTERFLRVALHQVRRIRSFSFQLLRLACGSWARWKTTERFFLRVALYQAGRATQHLHPSLAQQHWRPCPWPLPETYTQFHRGGHVTYVTQTYLRSFDHGGGNTGQVEVSARHQA